MGDGGHILAPLPDVAQRPGPGHDESESEDESSDGEERGVWELSDEDSIAEAEWVADDVPRDPWLNGLSTAEILEEEFDVECMSRGKLLCLVVRSFPN